MDLNTEKITRKDFFKLLSIAAVSVSIAPMLGMMQGGGASKSNKEKYGQGQYGS